MDYYSFLRKFLFQLKPETAHSVTLETLRLAHQLGLTKWFPKSTTAPCQVMGLQFPNPIGLAAGLDKNGDYIAPLFALGFGFIEIGTVTPRPQPGNPMPRLFRLTDQEALINRMGFNNKGIDYVVERLQQTSFDGILGINIGKNSDTPLDKAVDDYVLGFKRLAPFADYITLNISSPNTPGLRELQHNERLTTLLNTLKQEQALQKKYVPLVVKIAPDITSENLSQMADIFLAEKIDGIIATNTTVNHEGVENSVYADEQGGLSGKPLRKRSLQIVQQLNKLVGDQIPIIACGGISSAEDILERKSAGAKLFQIYTSLIYQGPSLVYSIAQVGAKFEIS